MCVIPSPKRCRGDFSLPAVGRFAQKWEDFGVSLRPELRPRAQSNARAEGKLRPLVLSAVEGLTIRLE